MKRIFLPLVALITLTILAACTDGQPVPVTRVGEATPTALPVATEQPVSVPTAPALLSRAQLTVGQRTPLHGPPPFTARLSASFVAPPGSLAADCRRLVWDFGGGTQVAEPCGIDNETRLADWQTTHRYNQAGTYHAGARLELADGTVLESDGTQTVIVATPQPRSLRTMILRWAAWIVLLTALGLVVIWLLFQHGRRRLWGAALLVLFLISFVPPFSYAPDPLGIVLAVTGGYAHDPRLPIANRFLVAGDPTRLLRPYLDGLVGQTGLDPLDPVSPLARYEFVKVARGRARERGHTAVHVRFTYADGAQRTHAIPLRQPDAFLGFYACCWRYDGLGRLRTDHRALPPAPFAGPGDASLGAPHRLALPAGDTGGVQDWFGANGHQPRQRLLWSPAGESFLAPVTRNHRTALWLFSPAQERSRQLAEDVWEYAWLPGGEAVLYSTVQQAQEDGPVGPARQIYRVDRDGSGRQLLLSLPMGQSAFPGITERGLWYVRDAALWLAPFSGDDAGQGERLASLSGLYRGNGPRQLAQVSPAPDGERVAYTCDAGLCLIDAGGKNHVVAVADERQVSLAWRADGRLLAATFWDHAGHSDRPATLVLLQRDGTIAQEIAVASPGPVGPAQWAPDRNALFLQAFPRDGRRILHVDAASGRVVDLSQARWDAFFALHPDGNRLLLSNGRGGFWLSPLEWPEIAAQGAEKDLVTVAKKSDFLEKSDFSRAVVAIIITP